ncbi:hypothetical protein DIZ81_06995 [Legionella taurinensis]|uniref:Replication protein n=2 Tax=Legionella taurinensis TaxID=70611 RepID=A0AB38N551_9GAMM|nr:hypothetical protein DB744_06995 [Legionella taurinensis]PUT41578.1 hypothetical protein DB746_09505 [Legionella taurinensis]PUT44443.1 hypothetical protein DB743_08720 [Legionella taurinensis]PUT48405.1 hypothetical protein DB745_05395 [Legionella taurinensis]TID33783.1 hypothetical protein DIZ41_08720 [Legionella taurinensis]
MTRHNMHSVSPFTTLIKRTPYGHSVDVYTTLHALKQNEQASAWREESISRNSWLLVAAPHGGTIEPFTQVIARQLAYPHYSLFLFEGLRRPGRALHVTSTRFRAPELARLQQDARVTLAIHGMKGRLQRLTLTGGLNTLLQRHLCEALQSGGFATGLCGGSLSGMNPDNFINLTPEYGVQLEISRGERDALREDPQRFHHYLEQLRRGIANYQATCLHHRQAGNPIKRA